MSLAVPKGAVANVAGENTVFVRSADRTFEPRPGALGEISGDWIVVLSGLSEGESIAVAGVFTLKSELLEGWV